MTVCEKCIHQEICATRELYDEEEERALTYCSSFKNKADVVEVRRGRWLPQRLLGADVVDCSECKPLGSPHWNWCPLCGADMRGNNNG